MYALSSLPEAILGKSEGLVMLGRFPLSPGAGGVS
jgi:hypothetical protein